MKYVVTCDTHVTHALPESHNLIRLKSIYKLNFHSFESNHTLGLQTSSLNAWEFSVKLVGPDDVLCRVHIICGCIRIGPSRSKLAMVISA